MAARDLRFRLRHARLLQADRSDARERDPTRQGAVRADEVLRGHEVCLGTKVVLVEAMDETVKSLYWRVNIRARVVAARRQRLGDGAKLRA